MLAGKGFKHVYNLSGGIKSWEKEIAIGPEDLGMELFVSDLSPHEAIVVGFGLEEGLRDYYLQMQLRVKTQEAKVLFGMLADIETVHQEMLVTLYSSVTGKTVTVDDFSAMIAQPVMEGGLTTADYLNRYSVDFSSELEILSFALAIEAQALDLYQRAAAKSTIEGTQKVLGKIAEEEREHIARLGQYIDQQKEFK